MTSSTVRKKPAGVFIDGSNMFWGAKKSGIKIDFMKLKKYLQSQYNVQFFNYYGCEDNKPSTPEFLYRAEGQKKFHKRLEGMGYSVHRKNLKHIKQCSGTKCDMDVEITMDFRTYENDIDCIILFTGDCDYQPAIEYYWNKGKHIRIFSYEDLLSWELKTYAIKQPRCHYKLIEEIKEEIEFVPKDNSDT